VPRRAGRMRRAKLRSRAGRTSSSLRVTPAMEAAISDHVWSLAEIVALLD